MSSQEDAAVGPPGGGGAVQREVPMPHPTHVGGDAQLQKHAAPAPQHQNAERITDPKLLRVLVVDSKGSSRTAVCSLLRDCEYQVTSVKSSAEALHFLLTGQQPGAGEQSGGAGQPQHAQEAQNVDLVIKEHEPPDADAGRLLKKMARSELLRKIPVVVMSSQDEREVVMNCLTLGAIDYLVKPLRHNELRHIWTRVWWWRRSGLGAPVPHLHTPRALRSHDLSSYQSSESKETKCDDEEEPTSKEGSAPDANNGSNGNGHGSNGHGSKDGNGTSRVDAKPHDNGNGNGNGSSDNKNGHHGSNGNGASTTLAVERNGAHPLAHTAEGRAPQGLVALDSQTMPKVATGRSVVFPGDAYAQTPLTSASRKRPFNGAVEPGQTPNASAMREGVGAGVLACEPLPKTSKGGAGHRDRHAEREARASGVLAGLERHEREGRGSGGVGGPPVRAPSFGAGGTMGGHSGAPSGSRGTAAAAATVTGSQPASKPHSSHDTNVPSQRAQLVHASGFGGTRAEGGASVSGFAAHGSGNGSRTAHGTAGGSTGADATGTISMSHFAPHAPHHLQASLPTSMTHLPSWGSLVPPSSSPHLGNAGNGSQTGAFPHMFPPFGLPPHMLGQALHPLSLYAPSPTVSGPPGSDALHAINPVVAANNFLQAMQLNQTLAAQQQHQQAPLEALPVSSQAEGCSSAIGSRGAVRGSSSQGQDTGLSGFGGAPGHQQLLMQYIQAFAQLGGAPGMPPNPNGAGIPAAMQAVNALAGGPAPGSLPAAQAALAAAWATGNPGAGLFPPHMPPHPHPLHHAHGRHPHHPHVPHPPHASLPPSAIQLAMQLMPGVPPASPSMLGGAGSSTPGGSFMAPNVSAPSGSGAGGPPINGPVDPATAARAMDPASQQAMLLALDPASRQAMMLAMGPMGPLMMAGLPGLGLPGPNAAGLAAAAAALAVRQPGPPGTMVNGVMVNGVGEPSTRRRRALALDKYRQKRKNLKFSTAIRYENRKAQAQARPRIKGQFAKAAQQVLDSATGGEGAEGSNACVEENDEDMPTMPTQDEDEEYDHGIDDDDNDMDDDEGGADLMDASGQPLLASSQRGSAGAVGSNGLKRQRSCATNDCGSGKRWMSRLRARGGATMRQASGGMGGHVHGPAAVVVDAGGAADGLQGNGHSALCEDEEDVADSLRELKEGRRTSPPVKPEPHPHRHHRHGAGSGGGEGTSKGGVAAPSVTRTPAGAVVAVLEGGAQGGASAGGHGGPGGAGPQTSLSLGSQSGLAISKGSHGRTSQHQRGVSTRAASGLPIGANSQNDLANGHAGRGDSMGGGYGTAATRGGMDGEGCGGSGAGAGGNPSMQRVSNHGRECAAAARAITAAHNDAHPESNQNNCKNGSDSGSNSPDENGTGNGSTEQLQPRVGMNGHGGHGKAHRGHDTGAGGNAR